jgi:hypothetical protein
VDRIVVAEETRSVGLPRPVMIKIPILPSGSVGVLRPPPAWRWTIASKLADGTLLYRGFVKPFSASVKSPAIGFCETDEMDFDKIIDRLTGGNMASPRLFEALEFVEKLAREIMLMDDRRYLGGTGTVKHAFKRFDKFSLAMAASGKVKTDSQLKVRVVIKLDQGVEANFISARNFSPESNGTHSTGWFSVQAADLEHYSKIASVFRVASDDFLMKMREYKVDNSLSLSSPEVVNLLAPMLLIMLEHKRNTSTSLQTTRYIVHSFTAVLSDQMGILATLMKVPIRSRLQALMTRRILAWVADMVQNPSDRSKLTSLKSLYSEAMVPFSITMAEMYYCNMFHVAHGMQAHREKEIQEKMLTIEKVYHKHAAEGAMNPTANSLYEAPQENCQFNAEFMKAVTDHWINKPESADYVLEALLAATSVTIDNVLKMTRTLVGAPVALMRFMETTARLNKKTVFEGVWDILRKTGEVELLQIITQMDVFASVFSTFAKPQIGAGREILIQAIVTRLFTAVFNRFFEVLCEKHPKDMITKEHLKAEIQSKTSMSFKEREGVKNGKLSVYTMINSDASKWAPNQVMSWYGVFIEGLNEKGLLPDKMYWLFVDILAAYANKVIYVPTTVKEKLDTWSEKMKAADPVISQTAEFANNMGAMTIRSGMGQGNFQHPSGFMHCVIDDYIDFLAEEAMRSLGVKVEVVTQISSDDSTKYILMTFDFRDYKSIDTYVLKYMNIFVSMRKLGGIMINTKKTAMQRMFSEFNSLFSIGKVVYIAAIKHIYNSVAIVDMTSHLDAVNECLANVRRVLESGCFISTVKLALEENRARLIRFYNLGPAIKGLTTYLGCTEADLPADLGFVPTKFTVETLLFGPMVAAETGIPMLKLFYEKVYSRSVMSTATDAGEDYTSKISIVLPKRVDRQLMELRNRVAKASQEMTRRLGNRVMGVKKTATTIHDYTMYLIQYAQALRSSYGFSSSMKRHSMVRAMNGAAKVLTRAQIKDRDAVSVPILSMVKKICKIRARSSFLCQFDYFSPLRSEARANKLVRFAELNTVAADRRPKFRRMVAFTNSDSSRFSLDRFVTMIMTARSRTTWGFEAATTAVLKIAGIDWESIKTDPVTVLADEGMTPIFKKATRMYQKMMNEGRVNFVLDKHSTGNRARDIAQIYMTRTDACKVFVANDEVSVEFQRAVNAIMFNKEITHNEIPTMGPYSCGDTREVAAIKALKTTLEFGRMTREQLAMTITYPRFSEVETFGGRTFTWLYGDSMAKLEIATLSMRLTLWGTHAAAHFVLRELMIIRAKTPGKKLVFTMVTKRSAETREVEVQTFINDNYMQSVYRKALPPVRAVLVTRPRSWAVSLDVLDNRFRFLVNENKFYAEVKEAPPLLKRFLAFRSQKVTLSMLNDFLVDLNPPEAVDMKFGRATVVEAFNLGLFEAMAAAMPHGNWGVDDEAGQDLGIELFDANTLADFPEGFMDALQSEDSMFDTVAEVRDKVDLEEKVLEYIRMATARELELGSDTIRKDVMTNVNSGHALGYVASSIAKVLGLGRTSRFLVVNAANYLLHRTRSNDSVKTVVLDPKNKFMCVTSRKEADDKRRAQIAMMNAFVDGAPAMATKTAESKIEEEDMGKAQ